MNDTEQPAAGTAALTARHPLAFLFAALGLAFAFDFLFYGHSPGISVAIFFALYAGALIALAVYNGTPLRPANLWPLPFFLFFACMAMVRENEFLTVLNLLAVFSGVLFLPFYLAAGSLQKIGLLSGALIPVRVGWASLTSGAQLHRQIKAQRAEQAAAGDEADHPRGWGRAFVAHWGGVLRGVLLALPILLVFGALLASADQIFAETLARIFSIEILDYIFSAIGTTLRVAILGWLAAGALVYAHLQRPANAEQTRFEADVMAMTQMLRLAFVETITVLTLVNLLFVSFVAIQISYLFGGVEYISTAEDFTYADYARSGFFELVITAVLCLAFVLAVQRLSRRESGAQTRWFNALTALLLGFVLILLISAYRRMALYESTFGYTELRLQVYVFIAWLGLLLLYLIAVILSDRAQHAVVGLVGAALGFLTTLNAINPDAFIVARNVDRHLAPQTIDESAPKTAGNPEGLPLSRSSSRIIRNEVLDISYLNRLSNDAVPELLRARDRLKADPAAVAQIQRGLERRRAQLEVREQEYQLNPESRPGWQSWHFGRARSTAALLAEIHSQSPAPKRANSSPRTDARR